jgi:hypothetical protein
MRNPSPGYPTFTTVILAEENRTILSSRRRRTDSTAFPPALIIPPVRQPSVFTGNKLIQFFQPPIVNGPATPATPSAPGTVVCCLLGFMHMADDLIFIL